MLFPRVSPAVIIVEAFPRLLWDSVILQKFTYLTGSGFNSFRVVVFVQGFWPRVSPAVIIVEAFSRLLWDSPADIFLEALLRLIGFFVGASTEYLKNNNPQ
jgi:hypothetical protein